MCIDLIPALINYVKKKCLRLKMAYLKWDESFSVGDKSMDDQHKLLFKYVGEFYDAVKKHERTIILTGIMEKILEYTRYHFKQEEFLMESSGYPGLELHKKIHQNLIQSVEDFKSALSHGKNVDIEVKHFLKQWLVDHIKCADQDYAHYIMANHIS